MTHFTEYTVEELESLPTLAQGQADDLKVDTGTERVWLSRCGPEDGAVFAISVEHLIDGRWVVVSEIAPFDGAFDNPARQDTSPGVVTRYWR